MSHPLPYEKIRLALFPKFLIPLEAPVAALPKLVELLVLLNCGLVLLDCDPPVTVFLLLLEPPVLLA